MTYTSTTLAGNIMIIPTLMSKLSGDNFADQSVGLFYFLAHCWFLFFFTFHLRTQVDDSYIIHIHMRDLLPTATLILLYIHIG